MARYVTVINGMDTCTDADLMSWASSLIEYEGVINVGSNLMVVSQAAAPGMKVLVQPGTCLVERDAYVDDDNTMKFWNVIVTVAEEVNIDSNSSGSTRYDAICVKIDTAAIPDADATNVATLVAVKGTPGAGVPAIPDNHLLLATVIVVDGETSILNAEITDRRIFVGPNKTGWLYTGEVPVYLSAGSFTVATGALTRFEKGDKVRFKQSAGTWKYGYIYDLTTTTLSFTGGTDYTIANEAITDFYIARGNAIDFPDTFNWTCTIAGTGFAMGNATQITKFSLDGRKVLAHSIITFGGTTNFGSGTWSLNFPIPTVTLADGQYLGSSGLRDAGTTRQIAQSIWTSATVWRILEYATATVIDFDTPWTWASGDQLTFNISYHI